MTNTLNIPLRGTDKVLKVRIAEGITSAIDGEAVLDVYFEDNATGNQISLLRVDQFDPSDGNALGAYFYSDVKDEDWTTKLNIKSTEELDKEFAEIAKMEE